MVQISSPTASTLEDAQDLLAVLYKYLLSPFEDLLAAHTRLIFIPDEQLPILPLHAAWNCRQYLIESHTVSYAPSASVLHHCQQREAARSVGEGLLVAGWEGVEPNKLPNAIEELHTIGALLHTTPLHGPLSIPDTLAAMCDARVIHLACHGAFPVNAHPLFAHLLLGPLANLYAHDIYGQRLSAELITLSACDTGLHGPGLQGLVSASLVAGASSVLASMWPVDDVATQSLMATFYKHLRDGYSRAEALQIAQNAVRCDTSKVRLEHPAFWAPFFLTGVPHSLPRPILLADGP